MPRIVQNTSSRRATAAARRLPIATFALVGLLVLLLGAASALAAGQKAPKANAGAALLPTVVTIECNKSTLAVTPGASHSAGCLAVVDSATKASADVHFSTDGPGEFSNEVEPGNKNFCKLDLTAPPGESVCSIDYIPAAVGTGIHTITAVFEGDATHAPSETSVPISVAEGNVRFAGPGGTGAEPCTNEQAPCSLATANAAAVSGDIVQLAPGNYTSPEFGPLHQVVVRSGVRLTGNPGRERPNLNATIAPTPIAGFREPVVALLGGASIAHVEVHSNVAEEIFDVQAGGTAEGVIARSGAGNSITCGIQGGKIRDSACLNNGPNGVALGFVDQHGGLDQQDTLRNLTAVATGTGSKGLEFAARGPSGFGSVSHLNVDGENVIARGAGTDVDARVLAAFFFGKAEVKVNLGHSDYKTTETAVEQPEGGSAFITPAGTNGNIEDAPKLAADGVHELAAAPTEDAGVIDAASGKTDVDGQSRAVGSAPDIGADELAAQTVASFSCEPDGVEVGVGTPCTVIVEDISRHPTPPGGVIRFEGDLETSLEVLFSGFGRCFAVPIAGSNSKASCQRTYIAQNKTIAPHHLTASYAGNTEHEPSQATTTVFVGFQTKTALSCASLSAVVNATVNCTATVTDTSAKPTAPSGRVKFSSDGPGSFGAETCTLGAPNGLEASCEISYSPTAVGSGHHTLTATFQANETQPSSSATAALAVNAESPERDPSQVEVRCSPSVVSLSANESTSCSALVEDRAAGAGAPTGVVKFATADPGSFSAETCNLVPANAGQASCSVTYTPSEIGSGNHTITASYAGDAAHRPGSGQGAVSVSESVRWAAPGASGPEPCVKSTPCQLGRAADNGGGSGVQPGDEIVLEPGEYSDANGDLAATGGIILAPEVQLHGLAGAPRPVIVVSEPNNALPAALVVGHGDVVSHLELRSEGSSRQPFLLDMSDGIVDDVIARSQKSSVACLQQAGTIRDSACLNSADGGTAISTAVSLSESRSGSVKLRNVTAVATGAASAGLRYDVTARNGKSIFRADDRSVIAKGTERDVIARAKGEGAGDAATLEVGIDHSAFATRSTTAAPGSTITLSGPTENANVLQPPLLRADGVHEAPDSPTVNAGVVDDFSGTADIDGQSRSLNQPDIGADEVGRSSETAVRCSPVSLKVGSGGTTCTATVRDSSEAPSLPEGTIHFESDSAGTFSKEATCTVVGEGATQASCDVDYLPAAMGSGHHKISAQFQGSGNDPSQGSTSVEVQPEIDPTTTQLNCAPATVSALAHVSCEVTVSDHAVAPITPSGEIKFESTGNGAFSPAPACALQRIGQGIASCEITFTPASDGVGKQTIRAAFAGGGGQEASNAAFQITVNLQSSPAETSVACEPTEVSTSEESTCTVTATGTGSAPTSPSGIVKLTTDRKGLFHGVCGLVPAAGAKSTCSVGYEPEAPIKGNGGTHKITALYGGDGSHGTGEGSTTISASNPSETKVSCTPADVGHTSVCQVRVLDRADEESAPRGEVLLGSDSVGEFPLGSACQLAPVSAGGSTCVVTYVPQNIGRQTISGSYRGSLDHRVSDGSAVLNVVVDSRHPSATTLKCAPETLALGSSSTCTATVADEDAAPTPATGKISFSSPGGIFSKGGTCVLHNAAGGKASCQVTYTPLTDDGSHSEAVKALYAGDENHTRSGDEKTLTVTAESPIRLETTTTVKCAPSSIFAGGTSQCEASVAESGEAGAQAPTGTVEFSTPADGRFSAGSCELQTETGAPSHCTVGFSASVSGSHQVRASYRGDAAHKLSEGSDTVNVNLIETSRDESKASLSCQPAPGSPRIAVTCRAQILDTNFAPPHAPEGFVELSSSGQGTFANGGVCALQAIAGSEAACELTYTPITAGTGLHQISLFYAGDTQVELSQASFDLAVKNRSIPLVHCQPNQVASGASSTCTATVEDPEPNPVPPTGTISFSAPASDGFSSGATCNLTEVDQRHASCEVIYTPQEVVATKIHAVHATYSGDFGHGRGEEATDFVLVSVAGDPRPPSTTELTCLPTSVVARTPANCLAIVSGGPGSVDVPAGKVQFSSDSVGAFSAGGSCELSPGPVGKASCELTYTPAESGSGTHNVTAAYDGNEVNGPSLGTAAITVTPIVPATNPTTTTLSCEPGTSLEGGPSTCVATVADTGSANPSAPSGKVAFASSAAGVFSDAAACTLVGSPGQNKASCQVEYTPAPGTVTRVDRIVATYGSDPKHDESSGTAQITVVPSDQGQNPTTTKLSCDPTVAVASAAACVATVEDVATSGASTPSGTVSFESDSPGAFSHAATCTLSGTGNSTSCQLEYTPSQLASGVHKLVATYGNDQAHLASQGSFDLTVTTEGGGEEEEENPGEEGGGELRPTLTTLSCDPASVTVNSATSCTATVKDVSPEGATAPSGKVGFETAANGEFANGASCELSGPPTAAEASCKLDYTPADAGSHKLLANYEGDSTHRLSQGSFELTAQSEESGEEEGGEGEEEETPGEEGGTAHATTTALSCSPGSVAVGSASTCTATVEDAAAQGATTPAGAVSFESDSPGAFSDAATCTLTGNGNKATCNVEYTPSLLASGTHKLTAAYQGTAAHEGSTGSFDLTVTTEGGGEEEEENPGEEGGEELHPTLTTLNCDPNSVAVGNASTCTATVKDLTSPAVGSPTTPDGKVSFESNSPGAFSKAASCTLTGTGDTATCNVEYTPSLLASGTHRVFANYEGSTTHRISQGSFDLTVTTEGGGEEEEENPGEEGGEELHPTLTTLSCDPNSVAVGNASTCTATVKDLTSPAVGSPTTPDGKVSFESNSPGAFSKAASCTLTGTGDTATCNVEYTPSLLGTGTHRVFANYEGSTTHRLSQGSFDLTVTTEGGGEEEEENPGEEGGEELHPTLTTLNCDPNSVAVGNASSCTATVKDISPVGATTPTGTVSFESDSNGAFSEAATCTLAGAGDHASCAIEYTPTLLGSGTHHLTANYGSTATHRLSQGSFDLTVTTEGGGEEEENPGEEGGEELHPTLTTLSCDPGSVVVASASTCTATVKDVSSEGATTPDGKVSFESNSPGAFSNAASCTLTGTGDTATCNVEYTPSLLASGTHRVFANYEGSTTHRISQGSFDLTVTTEGGGEEEEENPGEEGGEELRPTLTTLNCNPARIEATAAAHCSATVKDISPEGATTPDGEVKFESDSNGAFAQPASCVLVGTGDEASCQIDYTPAVPGVHKLFANYEGSGTHRRSQGTFELRVREVGEVTIDPTEASLSCAPSPVLVGAASHCTATIKDIAEENANSAGGKVEFSTNSPGDFSAPTCDLVGDGESEAACSVDYTPAELGVGTHDLIATYRGDTGHEGAQAHFGLGVEAEAGEEEGEEGEGETLEATTTRIACDPSSVIIGGGSVCKVIVASAATAGATVPTGNLQMSSDGAGSFSNTCALAAAGNASASCQTVYFPAQVGSGSHKVTATYLKDNAHEGSNDSTTVQVGAPNGGHTVDAGLECRPNQVILGGASVCTITLTDHGSTPSAPGGVVAFASDGSGSFATGGCALFSVSQSQSSCQIIYTPEALGSGTHHITAIYSGDSAHEAAQAGEDIAVTQPAAGHPTGTEVSCDPKAVTLGSSVKCTITVTDNAISGATAPGRAVVLASDSPGTFASGGCVLSGIGGGKGSCEIAYTPTQAGTHKLIALYEGELGHEPSRGGTELTVTAPPHPTATTVACAPSPVLIAAASTCTATVADSAQPPSAPAGTVKFQSDGAGAFGTSAACTLTAAGAEKATCQVTYTPSATGTGSHKITASYEGEPAHLLSQGSVALQVIQPPNTSFAKRPKLPRRKTSSRVVQIGFVSDQAGSTFQCKLDKGAFRACKSPFRARVKPGGHAFQVRAVSPQGVADASPATFRWKVLGPTKRRRRHQRLAQAPSKRGEPVT